MTTIDVPRNPNIPVEEQEESGSDVPVKHVQKALPPFLTHPNDPRGRFVSIVEVPDWKSDLRFLMDRYWVKLPLLGDIEDERLVELVNEYRALWVSSTEKYEDFRSKYNALRDGEQTQAIQLAKEECESKSGFHGGVRSAAKSVLGALVRELMLRIEAELGAWTEGALKSGMSSEEILNRRWSVRCFYRDDTFHNSFPDRISPAGISRAWEEMQKLLKT